ncbi:SPOR domain-containing protein [Camelimonas sp. ID_303_24]
MTDRSSSRVALDLDALEAGIASTGEPSRAGGASEDARLAELARIVGQNDRFRDLLRAPAGGDRVAPLQAAWQEPAPAHAEDPAHLRAWMNTPATGHAAAHDAGAADPQWDAYHQRQQPASYQQAAAWDDAGQVQHGHGSAHAGQGWDGGAGAAASGAASWPAQPEQDHYGAGRHEFAPALDPLEAIEGARLRRRRRSRTPLYAAVGVVALCVAASAGYFGLRGGGAGGSGEAPVIHADASAVKVKPPADSAAAPAPTKEIYEQIARAPGETKVVASNEQPVDVEQTLRQQRAAAVAAGKLPSEVGNESGTFGAPGVAPLPTHAANRDPRSGLGEPRRVRTVSIGPDGKVRDAGQQQAAVPQSVRETAQAPTPAARPTPPARPMQQASAKQEHRVQPTMVDNTPTGSVDAAAAAPKPKAVAAAPAGKGGFAVQLGAPGSEQEAKAMAASLKRKYGVLASHGTAVVKAQSNGRTIYRLRVPGLSRESATSLCQQLKSVGGSCFVAQG